MSAVATSWILSEGFAGLQAQALGLAEAAGLHPELRVLAPRAALEMARRLAVAGAAGRRGRRGAGRHCPSW